VDQEYLGVDRNYYMPTDRGAEADMQRYLDRVRGVQPDDRETGGLTQQGA
jgi:hypothetical protein